MQGYKIDDDESIIFSTKKEFRKQEKRIQNHYKLVQSIAQLKINN